jgi:multidrug resistance efflux pump
MTEHKDSPEMGQQLPTPVENKTPGAANAPPAAQPAAAPSPQPMDPMDPVRKWVLVFSAFCLVLLLWYLAADRYTPFTTQARVNAWVVPVASQVSGRILSIEVRTDESVKKDQLLAQIDPEDFRVAVAGAEAQLALTKENLEADSAAVNSAAASVASAKATLIKQTQNDERLRRINLEVAGAISQLRLEAAVASRSEAEASVQSAQANYEKAKATRGLLGEQNSQLLAARAALDKARLSLKYTRIVAPNDGLVTDLKVDAGNFVSVGQPFMTFIADQKMWIEANLTENNLGHLKPGNAVDLVLDVWPAETLRGRVRSVTQGVTAAEATSKLGGLPTVQNTRDWLRSAQRFPVVIDFEDPAAAAQLGARVGSQVTVTIYTGDHPILNPLAGFLTWIGRQLSYVY